jgi:hypothetical protein
MSGQHSVSTLDEVFAMTEASDPTTVREENVPSDGQPRSEAADPDLLHGGSGENEPPDGPVPDESTDDLLNGGSGENEPEHQHENEPPIERKDGQVYGG